jgi:hypothetical protein
VVSQKALSTSLIIGSHRYSSVPYLQFSPRELVIPPNVTRNVRISTLLPSNLPDGEYRAVVFLEDLKERGVKPGSNNQISIITRVASIFFVSKGNVNINLQANTATWDKANKVFKLVVSNKGNKSAYPNIDFKVTKDGGEIANSQIIGVVLQSGQDREILLPFKGSSTLGSGSYTVSGRILTIDKQSIPFSFDVVVP